MKVEDDVLRDVLFLDRHPGWTWQDMMAAPWDIVEGMRRLDAARGAAK